MMLLDDYESPLPSFLTESRLRKDQQFAVWNRALHEYNPMDAISTETLYQV